MKLAPLLLLAACPMLQASLADRKGVWDLDSTFDGYWTSFAPLNASSLTAGTDYSFGASVRAGSILTTGGTGAFDPTANIDL